MKININFPLSDEALSLACRINTWYVNNGKTDIVFSENGPYPHITLLMGEIDPDSLTEVVRTARELSKSIVCPTVCFTAPHKPAFDSEYVFLGVKRPDCLREIKEEAANSLESIFTPSAYGGVDIAPHVTLAYLTDRAQYRPFPTTECVTICWKPRQIAVSETGKHGTCMRILELVDLEAAEQKHPELQKGPRGRGPF